MSSSSEVPTAYVASTGGKILECNEEFCRLVGLPEKSVLGSELPSLCKIDDYEQLMEATYKLDHIASGTWKAPIKTIDEDNDYEVVVSQCPKKIKGHSVLQACITVFHPHRRDSMRKSVNLSEHKDYKEEKDYKDGLRVHKVLVVDDSPTALKLMAHLITRMGHQVETAMNGVDALEHIAKEPFDIVLMDINMPMMNGLQASHELRKMEQRHRGEHQKIIAMSGDISTTLFTEVSNAGFDAFIPKPLTEESFLEVLNMKVNRK